MVKAKAPVRRAAFGGKRRTVGICQVQRCPVIQRRLALRQLHLALEFQFFRRLIAGIQVA